MDLSEAEIQVLASLHALIDAGAAADRVAIEARGEGYRVFKADWSDAHRSLSDKGLIAGDHDGYRLSATGTPLARRWYDERPDLYWYIATQKFYPAARASAAHSALCERVFGEDLCQEGQTDMAGLREMMALLAIEPGEQRLDLGCGAGVIAE